MPGENVVDLFGGSGSTLLAAEITDRNAYISELDPVYADVTIERWETLYRQEGQKDAMTEPKKDIVTLARKRRYIALLEKAKSNKALSNREINELAQFENANEIEQHQESKRKTAHNHHTGRFDAKTGSLLL